MKLLPYTGVRQAIPAICLVAVNATYFFGPSIQLLSILAVFGIFFRHLEFDRRPGGWILLGYVGACLAFAILTIGPQDAVIKAGKLSLFCLASLLTIKGGGDSDARSRFAAVVALRAFLVLCALNFGYSAAIGGRVFRSDHFIEYSIYSGYTIAVLIYLGRPHLTVFDRAAAWVFSLLCGSTMGLLALMLAEFVGRRWRPQAIIGLIALAPIGFFLLNLMMEIREKEFTWEFLANSDRGMLIATFFQVIAPEMSVREWLLGIGAGQPLFGFLTPNAGFNGYIQRLGGGEVLSLCLHNETLRIICDYGIVGLVLVIFRLFANCSVPVLILLALCMLTNSYLYSFSGALLASSLFNHRPHRRTCPETEFEASSPSPAHA